MEIYKDITSAKEKEFASLLNNQSKTKIVEGKISSFYSDTVLNEQIFVNPEIYEGKVGVMIEEMSGKLGERIYVKKFSHLEVGK